MFKFNEVLVKYFTGTIAQKLEDSDGLNYKGKNHKKSQTMSHVTHLL